MVDLPVNGDLIGNGGFNQQYDEQFGFVKKKAFNLGQFRIGMMIMKFPTAIRR